MCEIIIGNEIPNDFMYLQNFFYKLTKNLNLI